MAAFWRQERGSLHFIEEEKKRIVDYLHEPDGGGGGGDEEMEAANRKRGDLSLSLPPSASSSSASSAGGSSKSPRCLLSRWLLSLQKPSPGGRSGGGGGGGGGKAGSGSGRLVRFPRCCRKKKKKKKDEEEVGSSVSEFVEGQGDGAGCRGSSRKLSISSDEKPEEISLNIGMGLGLVFLLTRCATEFKRMTEIQAQTETLLKEIKNEVQRDDVICSIVESSNDATFSGPDCTGNVSTSKAIPSQSHIASFQQEGARCATESDVQSNYVTISENKSCPKMDQLEAELEVELERLQLYLEGEDSSALRGQHKMELASESRDSSESFSFSFGQNVEPKNENTGEFSGVSALELERRLHELLHTRQREQIAELEYTLECTKRKLVEKEIELCRLRDSATHHKDETIQVKSHGREPLSIPGECLLSNEREE